MGWVGVDGRVSGRGKRTNERTNERTNGRTSEPTDRCADARDNPSLPPQALVSSFPSPFPNQSPNQSTTPVDQPTEQPTSPPQHPPGRNAARGPRGAWPPSSCRSCGRPPCARSSGCRSGRRRRAASGRAPPVVWSCSWSGVSGVVVIVINFTNTARLPNPVAPHGMALMYPSRPLFPRSLTLIKAL